MNYLVGVQWRSRLGLAGVGWWLLSPSLGLFGATLFGLVL